MPYIKESVRKYYKPIAQIAAATFYNYGSVRGNLNYFIFKTFIELRKKGMCNNYVGISGFLAELHECECEIRRRYLIPHEDKKIKENGDVE